MQTKPQQIKCDKKSGEAILRRLGGAMIVHWDALPEELRTILIEQAANMIDHDIQTQASHAIAAFVQTHKGGDLVVSVDPEAES